MGTVTYTTMVPRDEKVAAGGTPLVAAVCPDMPRLRLWNETDMLLILSVSKV